MDGEGGSDVVDRVAVGQRVYVEAHPYERGQVVSAFGNHAMVRCDDILKCGYFQARHFLATLDMLTLEQKKAQG